MDIKTVRDKLQTMLDVYCKGIDVAVRSSGDAIDISKKSGEFKLIDGEQECNVVVMIEQSLNDTGYKIQNEHAQGLPVVILKKGKRFKPLALDMNEQIR